MSRVLRQSKNGGISECRSPEDRVGIGRCHHLPGDENNSPKINYSKKDKAHYVNLGNERADKKKNEKNKKDIKGFVSGLKEDKVSEERAKEIINKIV